MLDSHFIVFTPSIPTPSIPTLSIPTLSIPTLSIPTPSIMGLPGFTQANSILGIATAPTTLGLLAASLAFMGWKRIADETVSRFYERRRLNSRTVLTRKSSLNLHEARTAVQALQIIAALASSFLVMILLTTSLEISVAISLLFTGLPFILAKRRAARIKLERDKAWPVAIDEIVASLQAGLSITESITELTIKGPLQLQPSFARVSDGLSSGIDLETLLYKELGILDSATADQTLITLLFAKEFGGREVISTLRMLSTFLREEAKVREEIDTRFGWVRNSAVLGAVAPWLLLALLSTQRSTVEAYQTRAGVFILSLGVIFTAVAFLWMERVSRIPNPPRPLRPRASIGKSSIEDSLDVSILSDRT